MFTEQHLVAFGNYLLKTYNVQAHSSDGGGQPAYQRQVSDADMANWRQEENPNTLLLPSRFQLDDAVRFMASVKVTGVDTYASIPAEILGIHFYHGKVKYDIEVQLGEDLKSRIYNVDSALVTE